MQVNSISNNQSFGSVNAIKPNVRKFLNKSVFVDDKNAQDRFKKTITSVRMEQKGNPFCDIEIAKHVDIFTGKKHPAVNVVDKTNGATVASYNINSYIKDFPNAQDKYVVTTALEEANFSASEYAFEQMDKALLKAEKERQKSI